ncbi:hypothetical protein Lal_00020790 [Lupinus albus]|nr:hypothetical protein Lal_00020790 [Lupinus albus]
MVCEFSLRQKIPNVEVNIRDHIVPKITIFEYFGSTIRHNDKFDEDVNHKIQKCVTKLKEKFYHTTIRSRILYWIEYWTIKCQ